MMLMAFLLVQLMADSLLAILLLEVHLALEEENIPHATQLHQNCSDAFDLIVYLYS
jgi:hypothetical protein